jgi:hypothetical protein
MGRWTERNRWRRGQWLVRDDESGFVHYADQVVRRWDGMYVRKDQDEPIDPQWFITAESDPTNVPFVRPDQPAGPACKTRSPFYPPGQLIQESVSVDSDGFELEDGSGLLLTEFPQARIPRFVGYDLYVGIGIGLMEIECSFTVFPDGA